LLSGQALGTTLCHLLLWELYLITMARIQVTSEIIRLDGLEAEIAGYAPDRVPQMTRKSFAT